MIDIGNLRERREKILRLATRYRTKKACEFSDRSFAFVIHNLRFIVGLVLLSPPATGNPFQHYEKMCRFFTHPRKGKKEVPFASLTEDEKRCLQERVLALQE